MRTLFIFFLAAIIVQCAAQPAKPGQPAKLVQPASSGITLDSFVRNLGAKYLQDSSHVGLSIGIIDNGVKTTWHFGVTNKKEGKAPDNTSLYEIGAITQTFMGTLLARAVMDTKLKLDDDIRNYIPGSYPNLEYDHHPIRIVQLLNTSSCLPVMLPEVTGSYTGKPDSIPFIVNRTQRASSRSKFYEELHHVHFEKVPGSCRQSSATAPQLLGYILENVYQASLTNLVLKYITGPLNMPGTAFAYWSDRPFKISTGYNKKGTVMPYMPTTLQAAAGLFSNVPDMLNYLAYHLNEQDSVVQLSHRTTLRNVDEPSVALGWLQNGRAMKNAGSSWQEDETWGFSSYCGVYPKKVGIVLLTNESENGGGERLRKMGDEIFRFLQER